MTKTKKKKKKKMMMMVMRRDSSLTTEHIHVFLNEEIKISRHHQFLALGYSYDKYLKAYGCELQKVTSHTSTWTVSGNWRIVLYLLKKRSTVDSRTKGISDEDYARCQAVWRDNGMKTMHDFLVWYNNRDVVPFLDAIDKTICLLQTAEHRYVQRRCKRPGTDIALSLQRTSVEHLLHCLQPDEQRSAPTRQRQYRWWSRHHISSLP